MEINKKTEDRTLLIFGLILLAIGIVSTLLSYIWQQYLPLGSFYHWEDISLDIRITGIFTILAGFFTLTLHYCFGRGE